MRAINIKNIHHSQLYYVFALLLLLIGTSIAANRTHQKNSTLPENAERQQQKLIDAYGLSQRLVWQEKCDAMIATLELTQFERCLIIKAPFANAYSLAHNNVILTVGLLKNISNDDQLAHILAHEHAHLKLNHHQQAEQLVNNPPKLFTKSRIKKFYRDIEQQADQVADELLIRLQRDPLQINHYLLRIEQTTKEHSNDHPKMKQRIKRNDLPDEVVELFWLGQ